MSQLSFPRALVAVLLLVTPLGASAAPPDRGTDAARKELEERRNQIQAVYTLGLSKKAADEKALLAIITSVKAPLYLRASAIRAIRRQRNERFVPALKALLTDKTVALKVEATIKLYHWRFYAEALPVLRDLQDQGVAFRRAFETGFDDGLPTYDENARAFFDRGLKSENAYVRMDSAMGLIILGEAPLGVPVLRAVLVSDERYHIRMAAVNYLTPFKHVAVVRELLELAAKDADERVSQRAKQVLTVNEGAEPEP